MAPDLLKTLGIKISPSFIVFALIASPFFLSKDWSPRLVASAVLFGMFGPAGLLPLALCIVWTVLSVMWRKLREASEAARREEHQKAMDRESRKRELEFAELKKAERIEAERIEAARRSAVTSSTPVRHTPEQIRAARLAAAEARLASKIRYWTNAEDVPPEERAHAINDARLRHREEVGEIYDE